MDEGQRKVIDKAYAVLHAVDEERQAEPRSLSFDEQYEREAEEADLFLAQCVERRRLAQHQPEPGESMSLKATIAMIDAAEARVRSFVMAASETLAVEAGKATGQLESRIAKLEKEIATLKASKPDVAPEGVFGVTAQAGRTPCVIRNDVITGHASTPSVF